MRALRVAVRSVLIAALAIAGTSGRVAGQDSLAARVAEGDAAWERGDHPAAFAAYDGVVRADSAYSTRALFRLGTLHAWAERLTAAVACHRLYVRLEPADLEGRTALGRTLAWNARFPESIAQYDAVLARDAAYRDAGLGKATALAWWGRLDDAIAETERWQRVRPADQEFALARAQFLSWAGRLDQALAVYDSLASGGASGAREAEKGRARVLGWRGDLDLAEARWREYLGRHGDDASAWVGLATVLRWMGRPFAASDALERALSLEPDDRDAREQLRWVRVETRPQATAGWLTARDSERNTLFQSEATGAVALRGNVRISGIARSKLVGASSDPDDAVSNSAVAALQWQPEGTAWTLRGELGVAEFPAINSTAVTRGRFAMRASGRMGASRWRVGAGFGREPLDDVLSSLDAAASFTGGDVDVSYALRPQLALGAAASVGSAAGRGVSTDRTTGLAALRWTITRGLLAALTHREVAWSEPAYGIFFAPQRFAITEASLAWERPRDLGFVAYGEVGVGAQGVRFESDPLSRNLAARAAMRLGWRPRPGREIIAGLSYANVAGAGAITASEYSYGSFVVSGRWTF